MKYGFLFGAGAEFAYKLPSGGQFALDIFRQDTTKPKEEFRNMRANVDRTTTYAGQWLPKDYLSKSIGTFGKSVFQSIIMSTVEHRREEIIQMINKFDDEADWIVRKMKDDGLEVDQAFFDLLGRDVSTIQLNQVISYNAAFGKGDELFKSHYFSGLLLVYKNMPRTSGRELLRKILLATLQLQVGALSEELAQRINDNLFEKKDEGIDLLDDFGELIKPNYSSMGVSGLEFLLENPQIETYTSEGVVIRFAQLLIEDIYASVLDYKAVIDSNWHYLYNPSSDWAKFCKICIFLLTVRRYISDLGSKADINNPDGYYNMLKSALDNRLYEASAIATTNYNKIIEDILGTAYPVTYLNGSVSVWYDPYLNKIGSKSDLDTTEHHIIVPLIFTQSGTKPMTSISMSVKYVDVYRAWKTADAVVVVGFGFGTDDEHINGILRTIVNDDGKDLKVVTLGHGKSEEEEAKEIARKIKVNDYRKIQMILVDRDGKKAGKPWTELLN